MGFLRTRRRRGSPAKELYKTCSEANDGPWRQAEVLQETLVQLQDGLDCTKTMPTFVPTAPEQSISVSSAAGRRRRCATPGKEPARDGCRSSANAMAICG